MSGTHNAGVGRRDFLKVLGATGAATAAVGCGTSDVERLIPYLIHPDNTVPGVSTYYATTCRECSAACGVIAEARDGRTIKLEGNPAHPLNRGALCARGQAALQGLYNPDRFRGPLIRQDGQLRPVSWEQALQLFSQRLGELRSRGGAANAVFINRHESGSFPVLLDEWLTAFGLPPHISYEPLMEASVLEANRAAYGVAWPALDFAAARFVLSLGADFLDAWGLSVPQQLDWADARAKLRDAPRCVYIGARRSLTGLNADQWIPARPGSELAVARALLAAIGGSGEGTLAQAAEASGVPAPALEALARELASAKPSLVLAGVNTPDAAEVAATIAAINRTAGNIGTTIRPDRAVTAFERVASTGDLVAVAERMRAGGVPFLMVRGANPVFTLPKAVGFAEAMARVPFNVSFSSYPDETANLCDLILPDHHPLEAWGDAQVTGEVISLQQPTTMEVFSTRQTGDVLLLAAKRDPSTAARFTAPNFREWLIDRFPGGTQAFTAALREGVAGGNLSAPQPTARPPRPSATRTAPPIESSQGEFYLVVYPSPVLGDGSGANKPWLQELPDPVSKICWQSWVEIHPQTAERLGVESGDLLAIETPAGRVTAPAYLYLGIRPDTVAMMFGQGHTAYGRYAEGTGVNPLDVLPGLVAARSGALPWTATKVRVTKIGEHIPLVTTEGSARQHGRGIAQAVQASELSLATKQAGRPEPSAGEGDAQQDPQPSDGLDEPHDEEEEGQPGFLPGLRAPVAADAQGDLVQEDAIDQGMYDPEHWSKMAARRWAMTIDLARCTGCSACVTACYAENNIPTVGAPYQARQTPGLPRMAGANLLRSREMSWIRLERYFEGGERGGAEGGDIADFEARFVPMLCQHCGNAPCEPVCPVYAAYHSPDGLNIQVYNRCVGTRYCSNNCPYKVRYFNWYGYGEPNRPQYAWPEPLNWQLNPDVTVRAKGVMEKCTFCVQRIREAEHRATLERRSLRADEFTVACAQTCPSRAITFGDAADQTWSVTKLIEDARGYHVFEELNTYTAIVYLKKVNHPAAAPAGA